MKRLSKLLGYMGREEAIDLGFTHAGSYFGIPLWIAPDADFMVATKWAPLEHLMTLFHIIEGFMRSVLFPHEEPVFQFQIGRRIDGRPE